MGLFVCLFVFKHCSLCSQAVLKIGKEEFQTVVTILNPNGENQKHNLSRPVTFPMLYASRFIAKVRHVGLDGKYSGQRRERGHGSLHGR